MSKSPSRLEPGTLWQRLTERTEYALKHGALQPIHTEQRIVESHGVRFVVHMAPNLSRKEAEASRRGGQMGRTDSDFDPFLPPEPDLTVAQVSDSHVGVLNKFNVIDNHLLIVTRDFQDQESLLGLQDFEALWSCMSEFEALGFYNSGPGAGSSQPHKHLQMVPLPLPGSALKTPIEPLIGATDTTEAIGTVTDMPFPHAFARLEPSVANARVAAGETLECYRSMLSRVGIHAVQSNTEVRASAPYNLLITRRWMLVVPRIREHFENISVNALGFVGSLFVRNESQLATLLEHGPMQVLLRVSGHPHRVSEP